MPMSAPVTRLRSVCAPFKAYASIELGPISFPAPILPIGVALTYLAYLKYTWKRPIGSQARVRSDEKKAERTKDGVEEAGAEVAVSEPQPSSHLITLLQLVYYSRAAQPLFQDTEDGLSIVLSLTHIGLISAECILLFYYESQRPRKEQMLLGAAWTALLLPQLWSMDSAGVLPAAIALSACLMGTTSIISGQPEFIKSSSSIETASVKTSKAEESRSSTKPKSFSLEHIYSASLLLFLTAKDYTARDSFPTDLALRGHPILNYVIAFLLMFLRGASENWQATGRYHRTLSRRLKAFVRTICSVDVEVMLYACVGVPLLMLGSLAVAFMITSFLTSCLGFRAVTGRTPTPPSFRGMGVAGGVLYIFIACGNLHLRSSNLGVEQKLQMLREFTTLLGEALGQTMVILILSFPTLFVGLRLWLDKSAFTARAPCYMYEEY